MERLATLLTLSMLLAGVSRGVSAGSPKFVEMRGVNAIPFRHISPLSAERHMHLYMGSGLGWTDFDRDGLLDLICCQGAPADFVPTPGSPPALHLSRSVGHRFLDQSAAAGFTGTAYAFGLTIADYNNDGFPDVFVTGLLSAALYQNNGDGTFADRTAEAGIAPRGFGAGCCWTDLDGDSALDLFYVRYIALDPKHYPLCTTLFKTERMSIPCSPIHMAGDSDSTPRSVIITGTRPLGLSFR